MRDYGNSLCWFTGHVSPHCFCSSIDPPARLWRVGDEEHARVRMQEEMPQRVWFEALVQQDSSRFAQIINDFRDQMYHLAQCGGGRQSTRQWTGIESVDW